MNTLATQNNSNINWRLVGSLIALNAAIIISWIAYHNYQPRLLERFGFTELSPILGYSKLFVMATVPPLAGFLADRFKSRFKNALPFVSVGVSVTALIFMTVAATIAPQSLLPLEQVLPVMIILWLISMNLFYAPALATLEEFVPATQITIVMGMYVLISDLVYALEPAIILLVDFVGASLTFILGGLLIGGSGLIFNRQYKKFAVSHQERTVGKSSAGGFISILLLGLSLGFIVAYVINVLPELLALKLDAYLNETPVELLISGILVLTAIVAYILSKRKQAENFNRVFLISFLLGLSSLALTYILPGITSLLGVLLVIPALAMMSVLAFPMAISRVGYQDKMLAAGIFVAGLEVPDSVMELLY